MALEDTQQLRNRFLHSIRFLNHFLKISGIYLVQTVGNKKKIFLRFLLSFCWLFLNCESNLYIFLKKGMRDIMQTLNSTDNKMMTINFSHSLVRLAAFFCEMPIHFFLLLLTYRSFFKNFLDALEPVDIHLGRPNVTSFQFYSISSLIYTAFTV